MFNVTIIGMQDGTEVRYSDNWLSLQIKSSLNLQVPDLVLQYQLLLFSRCFHHNIQFRGRRLHISFSFLSLLLNKLLNFPQLILPFPFVLLAVLLVGCHFQPRDVFLTFC